jgi:hypothetical protein
MDSILDTHCLKLNASWVAMDVISVKQAFLDAAAGAVTLLKFSEGYPTPFRMEDWINLPVGDKEDYVTTSRMHGPHKIAVPRVCVALHFNRLIAEEQPCTPENLLHRYGHKDAVTGKKLRRKNFSREHVDPRSHGGKNGWDNEVPMDRKLNSKRGNRPYSELGLVQPKILGAPAPRLPYARIKNPHGYKEWNIFLGKT